MEDLKMKKHVTVVGILRIVLSSLGLLVALLIFFVMHFARGFVGDEKVAVTVLNFIGTVIPLFIGLVSLLGIAGGIGILTYKNWARILVLVVSVIGLLNIPVGTFVGVYSIWVLMQSETVKLFESKQHPFD
ncbi:MAG: hypothetical protein WBJ37_01230 [Bacteroidales bacterium]